MLCVPQEVFAALGSCDY